MTGSFTGTATFGANEINQTVLTASVGASAIFVAKYNANGSLAWAKGVKGTDASNTVGNAIALDSSGNSYVTGSFGQTATFGVGEVNQTVLTTTGPFVTAPSLSLSPNTIVTGHLPGRRARATLHNACKSYPSMVVSTTFVPAAGA